MRDLGGRSGPEVEDPECIGRTLPTFGLTCVWGRWFDDEDRTTALRIELCIRRAGYRVFGRGRGRSYAELAISIVTDQGVECPGTIIGDRRADRKSTRLNSSN